MLCYYIALINRKRYGAAKVENHSLVCASDRVTVQSGAH